MIKSKCGVDDLLFITPNNVRAMRSTRQIHVQLPRLQMINTNKLELTAKTVKKITMFTPITFTPPRMPRIPSPSYVPRRSSPVSSSMIRKKSYFEHAFPE